MNDSDASAPLPLYFDPAWRCNSPSMRAALNCFRDVVTETATKGKKLRPRDVKHRASVAERLFCNLAVTAMLEPAPPVAVYRAKSSSAWYPHYGMAFTDLLDACLGLGLVNQQVGYWYSPSERSPTLIEPTATFLRMLPESLALDDLHIVEESPLILRTEKDPDGYAESVPLKKTRSVADLRAQMNRINRALREQSHRIEYLRPSLWATHWRRKVCVKSTQHHQLHRVFNNSTVKHGGRMSGGWWQQLSKAERYKYIRIDGETIVELDFSQLHLRLAYAHFDVAYPFGTTDDGYTIHLPKWNPKPDEYRGGCKTLTNALLAARKQVTRWPGKSNAEQTALRESLYAIPFKEARTRMMAQHPRLPPDAWEHGSGHILTRLESDVVVQVLLECAERGIVVLQVYDALVCKDSDLFEVGTIMQAHAHAMAGIVPVLGIMDKYALAAIG